MDAAIVVQMRKTQKDNTTKTEPGKWQTNENHVENMMEIFESEEGHGLISSHRSDLSSAVILHLFNRAEASAGVQVTHYLYHDLFPLYFALFTIFCPIIIYFTI